MTDRTRPDFHVYGETGLYRAGGYLFEEWLPELRFERGHRAYREMIDNDPTIGGILRVIDMLVRRLEWRTDPADDSPDAAKWQEFIDQALKDMELSWTETVSEILSFLPWGWCCMEQEFKYRHGESRDPQHASAYDDGLIAWRRWGIRGQDTLLKWELDETGAPEAMVQLNPYVGHLATIPLSKCLHFRTITRKNSPEGQALDPATPIPTPDGWRKLDDLQPGDKVFDEQGRIRYVLARADWDDRPCYEVVFNNGTTVVADAEHQWLTQLLWERSRRFPGKIRTTAEIAATVKDSNGHSNHGIPWAGALDYPAQDLLLDPYYLGLWLGDGTARSARISCHEDDAAETAALIGAAGYATAIAHNGPAGGKGAAITPYAGSLWAQDSPQSRLRMLGLIQNKHIPAAYLRASVAQRRALLAGLMDSDGTIDNLGRCEFVNINRNLIDGVAELVRSLGCGASIGLRRLAHPERNLQETWCVRFTPTWSPFRLSRKAERTLTRRARQYHYITDVRPVERRRTVCIQVDSPSHLFLAGEGMVPTHNSILRNAYMPYLFKKRLQRLEGIMIERSGGGIPVLRIPGEFLLPGATGPQQQVAQGYERIGRNLRMDEQMCVVLPSDRDPETKQFLYELQLLTAAQVRTDMAHVAIGRYDLDIARSLQADFMFLAGSGAGSYALATSRTGLFTRALQAWVDHVAEVVTEQAIKPLVRLNGGDVALAPTLATGDVGEADLSALAQDFFNLGQAGLLVVTPELQQHIAQTWGLPEPPALPPAPVPVAEDTQDRDAERAPTGPPPVPPAPEETLPAWRKQAAEPPGARRPAGPDLVDEATIAAAIRDWDRLMPPRYRGLLDAVPRDEEDAA